MSKSSEVDGRGTAPPPPSPPTGSADASPEVVPVEEGGGTELEGSTRGCLEFSHLSSHLPKKSGTYGSNNVYGLRSKEVI